MTIGELPRFVRSVLHRTLPADWRADILRDLEEAWSVRVEQRGVVRARIWLWVQCLVFSARFLPDRMREVASHAGVSSTDLKLALRSLLKAPLVGLLAVVSLGVGIGASVGAYTFVRGAFFTDLPFEGGDRIVLVEDYDRTSRSSIGVFAPEYLRRRRDLRTFEQLEAFQQRSVVVGAESPRVVRALFTTPGFLSMTGVRPLRGRLPEAADVSGARDPVAVLPYALWVSATGRDPDIVGRRMRIGGVERVVIGVMPESFGFPWADDLWLPFDVRDADGPVRTIGKLRPDAALAAARAELSTVARPDPTQVGPDSNVEHIVTGITRPLVDESEVFVLAIPIAVFVLLLVVMATNVANLVLARNAARGPELALRSALGASRLRIVGQLVTEVALLAGVATAGGVWLSRLGLGIAAAHLRFPFWVEFSLDLGAVAFAAGLAVLVTLVAGLAPALRATRRSPAGSLRALAAGASGASFGRLAGVLIVIQVTVCVGFLSAATLLGQSLLSYTYDRYGLPAEETLIAQVYFGFPERLNDPDAGLSAAERSAGIDRFMAEATEKREGLRARMLSTPGVRQVAFATRFPGNESRRARLEIEGLDEPVENVELADVGRGYFPLVDAPVVLGRDFTPVEHAEARRGSARAVIVNEPFVRDRLRGAHPIGQRVRISGDPDDPGAAWHTIVGVVPDLGLNPGNPDNAAGLYRPLGDTNVLRMAIRGDGEPGAWTPRLVEIARRVDPAIEVQWSRTLADQMAEPVMIFRGLGLAFMTLGVLALVLSAASIHALTACSVTRRTRELGIRQALGASGTSVVRLVLARAGGQLALGTLLGSGVALALLRMSAVMPWEVRQGNPAALLLVLGALTVAGLVALARPLSRALSIQPADAMRVE